MHGRFLARFLERHHGVKSATKSFKGLVHKGLISAWAFSLSHKLLVLNAETGCQCVQLANVVPGECDVIIYFSLDLYSLLQGFL